MTQMTHELASSASSASSGHGGYALNAKRYIASPLPRAITIFVFAPVSLFRATSCRGVRDDVELWLPAGLPRAISRTIADTLGIPQSPHGPPYAMRVSKQGDYE
jgi:hypothetical protein